MTNAPQQPGVPVSYADAGVDIDAGNALVEAIKPFVRATRRPGADAEIGGFGGLFDLKAAGFRDPVLVAATDGVGTKVKIAIETGIIDTIGIDLVAMCVNDLVVQGAEPLFFLDYFATGRLDPEAGARIVSGIAEGCRQAGAALIGGETAEMPGMYAGRDFDLAGFAVGAVERDGILPRGDVAASDTVLALASSGVHSNGYSLVRKLVADAGLSFAEPAPFDNRNSLGRALLEPTRIYVKPLLAAVKATGAVKAMAHITGGGITENLPRVLPEVARCAHRPRGAAGAAGLPLDGGTRRHYAGGDAAHLQLRRRHAAGRAGIFRCSGDRRSGRGRGDGRRRRRDRQACRRAGRILGKAGSLGQCPTASALPSSFPGAAPI